MEYVSFKRAKEFPQTDLPPEFILLWELGVKEGWESLPEHDFEIERAKNDSIVKAWLEEKAAVAVASAEAAKWSEVVSKQNQTLFKEWKEKRGRK